MDSFDSDLSLHFLRFTRTPPGVYMADAPLYAAGLHHRPGGGIGRRSGLVRVPHAETRG